MVDTTTLSNTLLAGTLTTTMMYRKRLASTDDLNNITQTGIYYADLVDVANVPNGARSFFLRVTQGLNASYVVQELVATTGVTYIRVHWWQTWQPWRKIVSELVS